MCGIAGVIGNNNFSKKKISSILCLMKKRGPDSQAHKVFKINSKKKINIFFSRLKIIDLSNKANQPLIWNDCVLVFNGEIYNYKVIRKILKKEGYDFNTESDSEVLLKALHFWGVDALKKINGMWSLCFHDLKKNETILSRDRFGEKPLFYNKTKNNFIFGSEINFIKKIKGQKLEINFSKIKDFLYYGYKCLYKNNVTFVKGVYSINPGEVLIFKNGILNKKKNIFQVKNLFHFKKSKFPEIKNNLIKSIMLKLKSDVPSAHLLSGGIDSSFLASISKKNSNVNTFSLISNDNNYTEKLFINQNIKFNKFKNQIIKIENIKNVFKTIQMLSKHYCSPVLTITSILNFSLMKEIKKKKYKVVFSGIGGDEFFTGYYHHFLIDIINNIKNYSFRKKVNNWEKLVKPFVRNKILNNNKNFLDNKNLYKYIYQNFQWKNDLFLNKKNYPIKKYKFKNFTKDKLKNRMLNELIFETVPVVLHQDDLNAMYHSIENRSPILDESLLKTILNYDSKKFIEKGYAKYLLRRISKNLIPENIRTSREKVGFNLSLHKLFNLKDKNFLKFLYKESKIFKIISKNKLKMFLNNNLNQLDGEQNNFLFNFIACKIFIEEFN